MKNTVIVCGMPRSGTRTVANILSKDNRLLTTAEFPNGVMDKLVNLIRGIDQFFDNRAYKNSEAWRHKERIRLIHQVWISNSLMSESFDQNVEYVVNKTPSNENYFEFFEDVFFTSKPIYIYCLRSPFKVIRSLKNMPWNKMSELENWNRWKSSFLKLKEMERICPNRICVVSFDDPDRGAINQVGETIYNKIGILPGDNQKKIWSSMQPAQPAEKVVNKPLVDLGTEIESIIKNDKVYIEASKRWSFL